MKENQISLQGSPAGETPRLQSHVLGRILLKPIALNALLCTMKNILHAAVPIVLLQLCLSTTQAQDAKVAPGATSPPAAEVLSAHGHCDYSKDGVTFTDLSRGQIFGQGVFVRTGDDSHADLFFRRTGTTVRLQPGTEIKLEKMTVGMKDGLPIISTLLDLRTGRIFTVVRSEVLGSTFEIRNAAGRSVVEGSGIGRYIITADGTHVAALGSAIPIKVYGETGITVIAAGQQFAKKDGKMLSTETPMFTEDLIQLDELQAANEVAAAKK
jgi:hypothetical protein